MAGEEYIADRMALFYDDFASGREFGLSRPDMPQDYQEGSYEPFIVHEYDLQVIRGIGAFISMCDSAGICALENLKNYTFGNGFAWSVVNRSRSSDQMALLDTCNDILGEFMDRNEWGLIEPELSDYAHGKGEFLHVLHANAGFATSEICEPAYLREPADRNSASDYVGVPSLSWSFGVGTPYGMPWAPLAYCIDKRGDHSAEEIVDAKNVVHVKQNVPRGVKRGISDFYCCYVQMRQRAKVLDNTAEGTAAQAAIAWIEEQAAGVTASQTEANLGARMDRGTLGALQQAKEASGASSTIRARRINKGSVITMSNGKKYHAGPLGQTGGGKEQATMVADAVGRYVGSRWQMPEFMFNNNASTANYASTFVAESPFVKATQRRQYRYGLAFERIFWRVLEIAIQGGRIPGVLLLQDLKRRVAIKCVPPTVENRDRLKETQRNQTLVKGGVMSRKTWAVREDLDYEEEVELGAEAESHGPSMFEGPYAADAGRQDPRQDSQPPDDQQPVAESEYP